MHITLQILLGCLIGALFADYGLYKRFQTTASGFLDIILVVLLGSSIDFLLGVYFVN
jgi:hypothetical protein